MNSTPTRRRAVSLRAGVAAASDARAFRLPVLLTLAAGAALSACLPVHAAGPPVAPALQASLALRGRQAGAVFGVPLAVDWKFSGSSVSRNAASPVVVGDTVYFSVGNRLYAVDLQRGALKWRFPSEGVFPTPIHGSPVISNGIVLFGAGDGMYGLDMQDGKQKWHYSLKSGVNSQPAAVGDVVYFGSENGRLYALNVRTGESTGGTWSRGGRAGIEVGGDMVRDFAVGGGMIYYITANQVLHAVDLGTGTQKWGQHLDSDVHRAVPVLNGEFIYLAAGNTLSLMRMANGLRRWIIPLPTEASAPPAVDENGTAYIVTTDRQIFAVDVRGRGVWRVAPRVDFEVVSAPIVVNNLLLVGTAQGGLYAFDTSTGALRWNYVVRPSAPTDGSPPPVATNITAPPTVFGSSLFLLSDDGTLTAFRSSALDTLPPQATRLEPEPGDYLNGRPPFYISARVMDEGSGVNLDTLSLKIDDKAIRRRPYGSQYTDKPGFTFNPDENSVEYIIQENDAGRSNQLPDGHHSVTLTVKDWMGNELVKTWNFTIDDTMPKRARRSGGSAVPSAPRGPKSGGPGVTGGKLGGGGGAKGGGR